MSGLLVIGGSDAGISAALRARECDHDLPVSVLVGDRFPHYSVCGLPYFLSGLVDDWHRLAHSDADSLAAAGIDLRLGWRAGHLDARQRVVAATDDRGGHHELEYERLVIATGASPVTPPIDGLELDGVSFLRTMDDALGLEARLDAAQTAVIVGGGYLGLELAEALLARALAVTVIEQAPSLLTSVDASIAAQVRDELEAHGVRVQTGARVDRIARDQNRALVVVTHAGRFDADLVIVVVGVRPNVALAESAGAEVGERGAIRVTRAMETNLDGVFAAGDCVETWHQLLQRPDYVPLGSTAHKQGRVAGENAAGGEALFKGTCGTQVVKVCDLVVARTGLDDREAVAAGLDPFSVAVQVQDRNRYYPGSSEVTIRLTAERLGGRLLGAQMAGRADAQIAKRIDIVATALAARLTVEQLLGLDLSYTPPFSSPWDALQQAALAWAAETAPRPTNQAEPSRRERRV